MRRAVMRLAAFAVLLGAVFVVSLLMAPHTAHNLRHELGDLDAWGPPVAIVLSTLLTCAFVPGPVLAGASGLLFGTALGTGVAVVCATLGASSAFLLARAIAQRPFGTFARGRLRAWTRASRAAASSPSCMRGSRRARRLQLSATRRA